MVFLFGSSHNRQTTLTVDITHLEQRYQKVWKMAAGIQGQLNLKKTEGGLMWASVSS